MSSVCSICEKNIPEERLKLFPETNICGRQCAEAIEQNNEVLQRELNYSLPINFSEVLDKILIQELESKKNTCLLAFRKFKTKQINEEEYIKAFKKFTWWIKLTLNSHGGRLIDTPIKYTKCQKCHSLSIVIWSPKMKNYFIGCSNFYNGCRWTKSIWKFNN